MAILKLYFAGTAGYADRIKKSREELEGIRNSQEGEEVIRIYFTGCQHKEVGGRMTLFGIIDPILDIGTDKLRSCFELEDGVVLDLNKVTTHFSSSAIIDTREMWLFNNYHLSLGCHLANISAIDLYGFSRGAVTTFFSVKKLNDLNIPLRVIANEPVPGDSKGSTCHQFSEGTLLQKSIDLSDCHNLERLIVVLGQYGLSQESSQFFKQMVPKVPSTTEAKLWLIPIQYHAGLGVYSERLLREIFFPREISSRILLESVLTHGLVNCKDELGISVTKVKKELSEAVLSTLPEEPRFLPRFLQKSFHFGAIGRLQWAPAVKEMMLLRLQVLALSNLRPEKFSQVRALIAIFRHEGAYSLLKEHVMDQGGVFEINLALRDFITEFDALIADLSIKSEESNSTDFHHFHRRVLGFLEQRLQIGNSEWAELEHEILGELDSFQGSLSPRMVKSLRTNLLALFADSPLIHPEFTRFIVELDNEHLSDDLDIAHRPPIDARPSTFLDLAKQLFFSSKARRKLLFGEFKEFLKGLELAEDEMALLALLLPDESVNSLVDLDPVAARKERTASEESVLEVESTEQEHTSVLSS